MARLVLVGASQDYTPPTPRFSVDYADELFEDDTRKVLEGVRADLGGAEEDMPIWVGRGGVQSTMLRAAERADLVVLGRRGSGAVKRMFVGSNSIAVAGRSPVPVVIVPDEWDGREGSTAPIVVGIDRSAKDEEVLTYAFARARDLGVPLIVVHAWQLPTIYVWSADDVKEWMDEVTEELKAALEPWKEKYPEVDTMFLPKMPTPPWPSWTQQQSPSSSFSVGTPDRGTWGASTSARPRGRSCTTPTAPSLSSRRRRRTSTPRATSSDADMPEF